MIPPFSTVDHRIDSVSLPWEERRVPRRASPERLRFDLPGPAPLPVFVVTQPVRARRPSWVRIRLGEWLMALGQRLAGADIPS